MRWIGKQIVLTGLVFALVWLPVFFIAMGGYIWLTFPEHGFGWYVYLPMIFMGCIGVTFTVVVNWYRKVRKW